MTSKSPVRSAEDVDEQALSYAEIKALATGNPLIIEKCDLEMQVGKLNIIKSSFLSQKYALEDKIFKHYPAQIKRLTERIDGYRADIATAAANKPADKDSFSMKIGGTVYADKKAAGSAILAECKAMNSPDPVPLGQYCGFATELSFDSFGKEYQITFKGASSYTVPIGTDIFGNITRLDNRLERFPTDLEIVRSELTEVQKQMETAKIEVEKPFPQEAELSEKSTRLNEINIELNLDKHENELVESAPDEGDSADAPERKARSQERER